jgi:hypothetical protein
MFRRQQQNTELAIEMEEYRRNRCFRGAMTAPYAPLGSKLLITPFLRRTAMQKHSWLELRRRSRYENVMVSPYTLRVPSRAHQCL